MSEFYKKSGVNLKEAEKLNKSLKNGLSTKNIGAFAGRTELKAFGLKLVNCCDGIGSKIIPLYERKMYKEIAIDLVAANLNDMATRPAKAVSFSDYIAVNRLESDAVASIVIELEKELLKYDCELLGGETSEIPHLLRDGTIDICGFAIGFEKHIKVNPVENNDIIVGLKSSGIHANGFSLIRKLFSDGVLPEAEFSRCLTPAYIYYNEVQKLWDAGILKSAANITGGGIYDNLIRIIPENLNAELDFTKIPSQFVFEKLKSVVGEEVYKVFNCGVGFCLVIKEENLQFVKEICADFEPFEFGKVVSK